MDDDELKKMQEELNKRKIRETLNQEQNLNRDEASVPDTRMSDFEKSFRDQMKMDPQSSEVPKKERFGRTKNLFGK